MEKFIALSDGQTLLVMILLNYIISTDDQESKDWHNPNVSLLDLYAIFMFILLGIFPSVSLSIATLFSLIFVAIFLFRNSGNLILFSTLSVTGLVVLWLKLLSINIYLIWVFSVVICMGCIQLYRIYKASSPEK